MIFLLCQGLEYESKKGKKGARQIGPRCNCKLSQKRSCVLQCSEILDEDRKMIFSEFWKLSWPEKRVAVRHLIDSTPPKDVRHRKDQTNSRRSRSLKFNLKKEGQCRIRVCKKMFLYTLGINEWSAIN